MLPMHEGFGVVLLCPCFPLYLGWDNFLKSFSLFCFLFVGFKLLDVRAGSHFAAQSRAQTPFLLGQEVKGKSINP